MGMKEKGERFVKDVRKIKVCGKGDEESTIC